MNSYNQQQRKCQTILSIHMDLIFIFSWISACRWSRNNWIAHLMRFGVGEFTAVAFLWTSSRVCSAVVVPSNSVIRWVLLKKMHKMLVCMCICIYQVSHLSKMLRAWLSVASVTVTAVCGDAQRDPSLPVCSVQEGGHESELQPLGVAVTQTQGPGFSNLASNFGLPALATLAQF